MVYFSTKRYVPVLQITCREVVKGGCWHRISKNLRLRFGTYFWIYIYKVNILYVMSLWTFPQWNSLHLYPRVWRSMRHGQPTESDSTTIHFINDQWNQLLWLWLVGSNTYRLLRHMIAHPCSKVPREVHWTQYKNHSGYFISLSLWAYI